MENEFLERLSVFHREIESKFDSLLNPSAWGDILEDLSDIMYSLCNDIQLNGPNKQLLFTYKSSYFVLSCQFLLSSYNLFRSGLSTPAYASLRSALENILRWRYLSNDHNLLGRSWLYSLPVELLVNYLGNTSNIEDSIALTEEGVDPEMIQEVLAWNRNKLNGHNNLHMQDIIINYKPDRLKESVSDYWFRQGIKCFYGHLCNHVHISNHATENAVEYKIEGPSFNMYGSISSNSKIIDYYNKWRRIAILLLCNIEELEKNLFTKEMLNEKYPKVQHKQYSIKTEDIVSAMWDWKNECQSQFKSLDLSNGKILTETYSDTHRDILIYQLPLCSRDLIILALNNSEKTIPIPCLDLNMKYDFYDDVAACVEHKKNEYYAMKDEYYRKYRKSMPLSELDKHLSKYIDVESCKYQSALKWLNMYGVDVANNM